MAENNVQPSFWTAGRLISTGIVAALIATVGYTLLSPHPDEKTDSRVVLPGTPISNPASRIPADFDVRTVDGRTVRLSISWQGSGDGFLGDVVSAVPARDSSVGAVGKGES
jgi:hypothetical protein